MMRTFSRMSTASSTVTVAVAVVCFFGNWKSQADAADSPARPAPSAEEPQIVLKATIIDIDSESMAKLGIALSDLMPDSTPDNSRAMPVTEKTKAPIQVASLTVGEGELLVKLLRGIGAAKMLAEPTVVSTIGRKASFHSGGHFLVPVPQANGGTIVETQKFGTFLDFTATKQASGQLRIEIRVGHSERDDSRTVTLNGVTVPGLRSRWFKTAFTARSGQTVMFVGGDQGLVVMVTPEVVDPQVSTPLSVEHLPHSMPATANRSPPQIVDEKPQRRDVRPSAKPTLKDEIRLLRNDVKVLRRDVGRLIDILEERDSTSRKTATPDDDHSSNMPEDANFKEFWDVTLDEVISLGLQNSKAIRDLGGVTPFGFDGKKEVVLSRVNKEVSLAEFEAAVRNLLSDAEGAYWELWAAHRNLDTAKKSRDSAQSLWNEIYEQVKGGMVQRQAEVQAREQYFLCRDQLEFALKELYSREGKLRLVLGLASSDGRLMRATDDATTEKYNVDWNDAKKVALSNSVELRQQRRVVEQAELELVAIKTSLQPQLDPLQTYRRYGAGGIDFLSPVLPTLGSRHAAAGVRHATLNVMREKARLEDMELNVTHLLTSATRSIDFSYQLAKTHFNRSLEAESELESTTMLYKRGKTTLDLVIDAQRRLAQSKIDHTSALAQYMTAIKDAHFRQGSLLGKHHVVIEMSGQRIRD